MEPVKEPRLKRDNPCSSAGLLSRCFFFWIYPLFAAGFHKELTFDDVYKCQEEDEAARLGSLLEQHWEEELKRKKGSRPSLLRALASLFGPSLLQHALLAFFAECIVKILQSLSLGAMVSSLSAQKKDDAGEPVASETLKWSAAAVVLTSIAFVVASHPYFFGMQRLGMKVRIACSALIYRKALGLSSRALRETTVGQMVNLLSNDVARFDYALIFIPYLLVGPLQLMISVAVLWPYLGVSCLVAVAVLLLYMILQTILGRRFSQLREETALLTDERIRLISEILIGMRAIKMYAWEKMFATLLETAREREIARIRRTAFLRGLNMALFFVSSKITLFLCLVTFVFVGNNLEPSTVFLATAVMNALRGTLTLYFPYAIANGAETLVCIARLEKLLMEDEFVTQTEAMNASESSVAFKKLSSQWVPSDSKKALAEITLRIRQAELTMVVGAVASGKSSLIMTILGELPPCDGHLEVKGKISYAAQEPLIFAGTVRDNIVFGSPFDKSKYRAVLSACALDEDLARLPRGDQSFVGERGLALSGGQKARISLARAVYLDADIYLLDEPFSAVDAKVVGHIFSKCIKDYLKDKVVVLVTHQPQLIESAAQIVVLEDGNCVALGSPAQLKRKGFNFNSLSASAVKKSNEAKNKASDLLVPDSARLASHSNLARSNLSLVSCGVDVFDGGEHTIPSESQSSGRISLSVYWRYIRGGSGPFLLSLLIVSNIATQVLFNAADYWLAVWSAESSGSRPSNLTSRPVFGTGDSSLDVGHENDKRQPDNQARSVLIYSLLTGGLFAFSLIRTSCFFSMCLCSANKLHECLFQSVIRAPMAFFDKTPVGALFNRFSRDMGIIDDLIPPTAFDAIEIFINLIGILVMILMIDRWTLVPTFVLAILFFFLREVFARTARAIKRLEGVARSPLFAHTGNTLHGVVTIRAFAAQKRFIAKFDACLDEHSALWFIFISLTRTFGIILDWLCIVFVGILTVLVTRGSHSGSEAGLVISSAFMLTGMFQWGVRQSVELESQMTSVERVLEYSDLPVENVHGAPAPSEWPTLGKLEFAGVCLKYRAAEEYVLKDVTLTIADGEKIGIVGRTGAGKSSLVSALFRLAEFEGIIRIDGVEINTLSLADLRSKLSIIPQEPMLFKGSLRHNLDPFGEFGDEDLWRALDVVQLMPAAKQLCGGLDATLAEAGANLSVGQRQLLCMARAVLKQNRILILDEATANVDSQTDNLIQSTVRATFKRCTVLTIAHRLNTIMDSDRVLVLDAGRVLEMGSPSTLLAQSDSVFTSMVQAARREAT